MKQALTYLFCLLVATSLLVSCGSKKHVTRSEQAPAAAAPAWHTVAVQGQGTIVMNGQSYSANCTLQAVYDSLVTLSVMPLLGIEIMRLEASPDSLLLIDKLNRRYSRMSYTEAAAWVQPAITYRDLQALASGELQKDESDTYSAEYMALGQPVTIRAKYQSVRKDEPLRVQPPALSRYRQVEPKTLFHL